MSEMVEWVARTLEDRTKASPYVFVPQDGPKAGVFGINFDAFARAAIEAMREPTEAMRIAASTYDAGSDPRIFCAMIDAALKP